VLPSTNAMATFFSPNATRIQKKRKKRGRASLQRKLCREINLLQISKKPMIPKKVFNAIVSSVLAEVETDGAYRLSRGAREVLQYDGEYYVSVLFEKSNKVAEFLGKQTVTRKMFRVVRAVADPMYQPLVEEKPEGI
jgi:histone H3/H4